MSSVTRCGICGIPAKLKCTGCYNVCYCSKEHQKVDWKMGHKGRCKCMQMKKDDVLGRYYQATRDIKRGEIVLQEHPLAVGPKISCAPLCLGCHKNLTVPENARDFYKCSKCSWPLCNKECETSVWHVKECQLLFDKKFVPQIHYDPENPKRKESAYCAIMPLRCALLSGDHPNGFEKLMDLESHVESRMNTQLYQVLRMNLMMFFKMVMGLEFNERTILTICAVLDTNAFEIRQSGSKIRGIYPAAAIMAHNCVANTRHYFTDDLDIVFVATTSIKKGQNIYTSYGQALQSTIQRRVHLRQHKYFDCRCDRCSDVAELGTFAGSIICPKCYDAKMISESPLDDFAPWKCASSTCDNKIPGKEILAGQKSLMKEITALDRNSPKEFESFLNKYRGALHETNSYMLQVKYALTQMYGNMEGYRLNEIGEALIERKTQLCEELIEIADVIEPGLSSFRGFLLLDLYVTKLELFKRYTAKEMIDQEERQQMLQELATTLIDLNEVMKLDPNMKVVLDSLLTL